MPGQAFGHATSLMWIHGMLVLFHLTSVDVGCGPGRGRCLQHRVIPGSHPTCCLVCSLFLLRCAGGLAELKLQLEEAVLADGVAQCLQDMGYKSSSSFFFESDAVFKSFVKI